MELKRLVLILKEANLHYKLLDDFQMCLIFDRTQGYKQHGAKVNITSKQEKALEEIAEKLFI